MCNVFFRNTCRRVLFVAWLIACPMLTRSVMANEVERIRLLIASGAFAEAEHLLRKQIPDPTAPVTIGSTTDFK